jgi:hypothetical protein
VDVWSLGMIISLFCSDKKLFKQMNWFRKSQKFLKKENIQIAEFPKITIFNLKEY